MRWTRATPADRVIGAALAFDAKAAVVPDPEAPPEPEPGPDPEPPEPEPPSPPTEGLEPPVAGATHVGLKVGPARQTITAIGFGLGSPGGESPAKTLEKHTKVLVHDPGANSIRLNGPSTAYVDSCKVLADAGIKLVHVTSYENNLTTNPVGSAKSFVGGVMQLLGQGVKVTSISSRNEPSYRLWGGDKARAIHKAYREELDRQGLQKIVLVSPSSPTPTAGAHDCARDLKGMMGKEIGAWGCHSYGLGLDEKLSQLVLPQGIAFVQHESGYGSWAVDLRQDPERPEPRLRRLGFPPRSPDPARWRPVAEPDRLQRRADRALLRLVADRADTAARYASAPGDPRLGERRRRRTHAFQADVLVDGLLGRWETLGWPLGGLVMNNGAAKLQALVELPEKRSAECRGVVANGAKAREVRVSMKDGQLRTPALAKGDLLAVDGWRVLMLVGAPIFAVAVRRGRASSPRKTQVMRISDGRVSCLLAGSSVTAAPIGMIQRAGKSGEQMCGDAISAVARCADARGHSDRLPQPGAIVLGECVAVRAITQARRRCYWRNEGVIIDRGALPTMLRWIAASHPRHTATMPQRRMIPLTPSALRVSAAGRWPSRDARSLPLPLDCLKAGKTIQPKPRPPCSATRVTR